MRLQRSRSRLSFRQRRWQPRRSPGCASLIFSALLVMGAAMMAVLWMGRFGTPPNAPQKNDLVGAAQAAFERGDLSGAINHARQHLANAPNDINALYILTRALIYRSYSEYNRDADRASALAITTEAVTRNPNNSDMLAIHALALQAENRPAEAATTAERALKEDTPASAIARTALALAYDSVGSYETALRESERAVNTANSRAALVDALRAQAISQRDVGRYQDAITTVDRAIALDEYLLALHFERAQYALLLGNSDSATVSYFTILTHDENNVKARLRLCELSSVMRERERAVEYCHAVTERAPSWSEGWYRLGMEYFLQGNFEEAQGSLRRCATLQTLQNVPAADRRFECWYIQGQAAEIRGDCPSLIAIYNEWRTIAADAAVRERWTYPPEGPTGCVGR